MQAEFSSIEGTFNNHQLTLGSHVAEVVLSFYPLMWLLLKDPSKTAWACPDRQELRVLTVPAVSGPVG